MGFPHAHELKVFRFVVSASRSDDPRAIHLLKDAHALGMRAVTRIDCADLYFVAGGLDDCGAEQIARQVLADPLTQTVEWSQIHATEAAGSARMVDGCHLLEVALRPGVTDPVAEQILRAAQVLQIPGADRASTGQRFLISGQGLDEEALSLLAARLLSNPVIQRYTLGEVQPAFPEPAQSSGAVEVISIRGLDQTGLLALSRDRRAALDLPEMEAIQAYYRSEDRDMTDVEFEAIAQTWSEHCVHKTFKARITVQNPRAAAAPGYRDEQTIDNLLRTYFRAATEQIAAPWVRSAFVDNAGILDFDQDHEVSFKVETHNHPSAIEPFGGANTGVGGVIRDVIGVSAKPIAATDVLCFGPPDAPFEDLPPGVLHPLRIRSGVVAGVQDYGNKIGIPTVSGAVLYDPGFTANPLVFCGCVGIAPKGSHPRAQQPGDRVIVLGGGTGRDGLRGATFSSMTMDAQTGEVSGASVQIGAPIVEKGLIDVIMLARDRGLYTAITDCGAGGLSSAVGEMAAELGGDVDLAGVQLKYPGLSPWEIWLSEAQERMVLAVPPAKVADLQALCDLYGVRLTDIGAFTATGRLVVRYGPAVVLDLANHFLHDGIPQRQLLARLPVAAPGPSAAPVPAPNEDFAAVLCSLLRHPNVASKAAIIRIYDHEVQGGTVLKPLTGAHNDGPSDAVVIKPAGTGGLTAIALGAGINPEYGKRSPYHMAWSVIDEAVRNVVAVGADPGRIALLDNFCWGSPTDPETLGGLVEAARGCRDAALLYGAPFVSGKDSLNNEYLGKDGRRHAIPPTLLISSLGWLADLTRVISMDLKQPGSLLYRAGAFQPTLAASHYALVAGQPVAGEGPQPAQQAPAVYRAIHAAIQAGMVLACHDLSEGGLAVAAAEMCIGGRLGLELEIETARLTLDLFGETNGCLLLEIPPERQAAFEALFGELPLRQIGRVTAHPVLTVSAGGQTLLEAPVAALAAAWTNAA